MNALLDICAKPAPVGRDARALRPLTASCGIIETIRWLIIGSAVVLSHRMSAADWTPPPNPNPEQILNQAEADTDAGRYADALAKHVWFHENALRYAPAMYGVRLSFALSSWGDLARLYPPALEKLRAVRDEAAEAVRSGADARHAFHDFSAINAELKEEEQTKTLFLWLDANDSKRAKQVFSIAEPVLVEQKQYRVCGKYITDPDRTLDGLVRQYEEEQRIANDPAMNDMKDFAERSFEHQAATLVALLVLNDRKAEAGRVASRARSVSDSRRLAEELDAALKGVCPKRWP